MFEPWFFSVHQDVSEQIIVTGHPTGKIQIILLVYVKVCA
jgi:hypothetical protein